MMHPSYMPLGRENYGGRKIGAEEGDDNAIDKKSGKV
jgi:hypothetical protein